MTPSCRASDIYQQMLILWKECSFAFPAMNMRVIKCAFSKRWPALSADAWKLFFKPFKPCFASERTMYWNLHHSLCSGERGFWCIYSENLERFRFKDLCVFCRWICLPILNISRTTGKWEINFITYTYFNVMKPREEKTLDYGLSGSYSLYVTDLSS